MRMSAGDIEIHSLTHYSQMKWGKKSIIPEIN